MRTTHAQVKVRGSTRVNAQQVIFKLKHKIVLALNKLADRDTYQIGVDELEKTAQALTPDVITPFLSCILDTDSEQKSAIRKECIRLMGTMARFHEGLIVPHLPKMAASIVKRLRDQDSIVRDVCVETVGILASKLVNREGESHKAFVVLVRPLFEALGEQNKQVQSGSAFCLARIVDNTLDPPISVLQRMLTRAVKLLRNPNFMAKPAILELNRSIIQAGGAPTQNILSTSIASIQEALKDSDWTTRKAASVALGEIGLSGRSFLGSLRASSIRSLESCRFDKVKPVRDAVLQALKYWRSLPGSNTTEPSETGSSLKENICGSDSADLCSTSESGQREVKFQKVAIKSTTAWIPHSVRNACQNYAANPHYPVHPKQDNWHVEIAVPRTHDVVEYQNEESESSSVTKALERMSTDVSSMQDIPYEYVPMDDKQECSSVSNLATDNCENKFLPVSNDCSIDSELLKQARSQHLDGGDISSDEQIYSVKMQSHRSSDSTVTHSSSRITHGCCAQTANEVVCIQNQLLDIETKQANLMDQLQVFTNGIMNTLSTIQARVAGLEHVLDRLTQDPVQVGRYSYSDNSKLGRQSQVIGSPRFSICTPRPSVNNRQPARLVVKDQETWEEKAFSRSQIMNPAGENADIWTNSKVKKTRNFAEKDICNSSGEDAQSKGFGQMRKNDGVFSLFSRCNSRNGCPESKTSYWKRVKGLLCEGDLDSAYMEALCSGDELVLLELLNKTGPVLESLSPKTVDDLLSMLASYVLEGRFLNTIIPWLQQVVDLITIHGPNCIAISLKARAQLLSAVQEAVNLKFFGPTERQPATQLAMKLHHIWGKCS